MLDKVRPVLSAPLTVEAQAAPSAPAPSTTDAKLRESARRAEDERTEIEAEIAERSASGCVAQRPNMPSGCARPESASSGLADDARPFLPLELALAVAERLA
jgi:hypothetical protein